MLCFETKFGRCVFELPKSGRGVTIPASGREACRVMLEQDGGGPRVYEGGDR
jgi:hypothetical protein